MTPAMALKNPVLWIHGEALGPANPALLAWPGRPAVFVFDDALIAAGGLSLKRLGFLYECLIELPVTIRRGDVAAEVLAMWKADFARYGKLVKEAGIKGDS